MGSGVLSLVTNILNLDYTYELNFDIKENVDNNFFNLDVDNDDDDIKLNIDNTGLSLHLQ